jgi:hypothetical protein
MDLKALFAIMNKKGFHYLDGSSVTDNSINLYFSTGYNTRGNSVEIIIRDNDNDFEYWIRKGHIEDPHDVHETLKNVDDPTIFKFINEKII